MARHNREGHRPTTPGPLSTHLNNINRLPRPSALQPLPDLDVGLNRILTEHWYRHTRRRTAPCAREGAIGGGLLPAVSPMARRAKVGGSIGRVLILMSRIPRDLQGAVPELRAFLRALPDQTEIGFDDLRLLCLCAITAAGQEDAEDEGTVLAWRPLSEAASVLAAALVYRALRRGAPWQVDRDRHETLHAVVDLLHALSAQLGTEGKGRNR
jgi:hypothetical protein